MFLGSCTSGSEGCLGPVSPKCGLAQPSQSHLTVAVQRPPSQVHPGGPECIGYASEGAGRACLDLGVIQTHWLWDLGPSSWPCGTPFLIYKMGDM